MYLGQSQSSSRPCVGNFQLTAPMAIAVWNKERLGRPFDEIYQRWYYIPEDTLSQLIQQALALPHADYNGHNSGPVSNATVAALPLETKCGMAPQTAFTPTEAQTWWQSVGLPATGPHPAEPPPVSTEAPPGSPGLPGLRDDIGIGTIALLGLGAWWYFGR